MLEQPLQAVPLQPASLPARVVAELAGKRRERGRLAALDCEVDFAEIARKDSEDPDSADRGGDIGYLVRGVAPEALPIVLWFVGYLIFLRIIVPRMRDRSKEVSEGRSMLTGRIVDPITQYMFVQTPEQLALYRRAEVLGVLL